MANDLEKTVRKWTDEVSRELAAVPFDLAKCESAYSTLAGHLESLLDDKFSRSSQRQLSHARTSKLSLRIEPVTLPRRDW